VRAYQVRGHHVADLDPLGILDADLESKTPPELELSHYGFTERDLDKQISLGPGILPHFMKDGRNTMPLREIIAECKRIYCTSAMPSPPLRILTRAFRRPHWCSVRAHP
jgi:2-oxoglutarate dehydrogenase E1 component